MEDNFNKILSDKFQNHKPALPQHLWAHIEPRIQKENKDRGGLLFFGLSLIVVSLVFVVYRLHTASSGNIRSGQALNNVSFHKVALLQPRSNTQQVHLNSSARIRVKSIQAEVGMSGKVGNAPKAHFANAIVEKDQHERYLDHSSIAKRASSTQSVMESNAELAYSLNDEAFNSHEQDILLASLVGSNYSETDSDAKNTLEKYGVARQNKSRFKAAENAAFLSMNFSDSDHDLAAHLQATLNDSLKIEPEELSIPIASSKTDKKLKKNADLAYKHATQLVFSPLKVLNTKSGVDQGYELAASYTKSFSKRWTWSLGCSYTSLGTPLHYEVPQSTTMTIAPFDPTKFGNGNTLTTSNDSLQYYQKKDQLNDKYFTLQSVNVLGLSLGFGYSMPLHQKWTLHTGLAVNPSLILKTSHSVTDQNGTSAYKNKMGAKGFNTLGLSNTINLTLAYRPIKKAEILCGVKMNYFGVSIHKSEQMRPLSFGPVLGLRWLF